MPSAPRPLPELLAAATGARLHGPVDVAVSGVTQDSRRVTPGACFVAVPGFRVDGHRFLEQAVQAGASVLAVQADKRDQWAPLLGRTDLTLVELPDTRAGLASLAAAYLGFPARKLTVIGVTGTDGKSSTCYLTAAMLDASGLRCGLIGGVEFKIGDEWRVNALTQTSPEADLVQSLLAEIVAAGCSHVVLESTSHGLSLNRLDHCAYDVAAFTGLSDDHLDFHGTREEYLQAKLRLFHALDDETPKTAGAGVPHRGVARVHEPHLERLRAVTRAPFLLVGQENEGCDISASEPRFSTSGSDFRLVTPAGALQTSVPLPGAYNLDNALIAAGAAFAAGARLTGLIDGLRHFRGVPGRMERIDAGQPFDVIVDAAATAVALDTVLAALRPHVRGRVILVFGVAGERDPSRRTGMGTAAARGADHTIITSENPRREDPAAIVRDIANAMRGAGAPDEALEEEPDRRAAIRRAFALAKPGDLVLIAGKGAEQSLIFADHEEPWDDRAVARELLAGAE